MQTRSQSRKMNEKRGGSQRREHTKSYMQTRSQSCNLPYESQIVTRSRRNLAELEVNIDFDDASRCWKKNKVSIGNGCYRYK